MTISPIVFRPATPRFGTTQTPDQEVAYWQTKVTWVTKRLDAIDFNQVSASKLQTLQAKLMAMNPVFQKITDALAKKQAK